MPKKKTHLYDFDRVLTMKLLSNREGNNGALRAVYFRASSNVRFRSIWVNQTVKNVAFWLVILLSGVLLWKVGDFAGVSASHYGSCNGSNGL